MIDATVYSEVRFDRKNPDFTSAENLFFSNEDQ